MSSSGPLGPLVLCCYYYSVAMCSMSLSCGDVSWSVNVKFSGHIHLFFLHDRVLSLIPWAASRQNLSLGFSTKPDINQSPQLQRF